MTSFIYALKCPTTGIVRYVGKSKNPSARFVSHLHARELCRRTKWIRSLQALGLKPVLEILDEVPAEHWQQWEVAYIEFFREQGFDLVNGHAGGEGAHNPTEETRKKLSAARLGKKFTLAHRANIRAACIGKKHTPETRAKQSAARQGKMLGNTIWRGKKHRLETRDKMSAARKLWWASAAGVVAKAALISRNRGNI